ncbi:2OG-Fe(II)-dependent halogenase WelO5 family protein [Sorangium sp. So ce406]|uniref:2OG-Fe(II)-dependent halogenase WelO5 family protein n=1 Tax=Sorangium sp. So ce406 TaxID=3133311 RepID=UPI003F5BF8D3
MSDWDCVTCSVEHRALGPEMLRALVRNECAVLVLRDLMSPALVEETRRLVRAHYERALATRYANGTLTTIGPYLAKHLAQPDRYFEDARVTDEVFSGAGRDPRLLAREGLRTFLGLRSCTVAREADGRMYADSVVRIHADGVRNPLHNDNIMRDAADTSLVVRGLRHQLSCIVCIQECDEGGELIHYRKAWDLDDEAYKIKDGLGYERGVVHGVARQVFKPRTGDVYLINPTNYHEIERVRGRDRVTMGFFLGFLADGLLDAIVWS